ncbi:hypothetical protein D3C84_742950 [compost metagenome]
MLVVLLGSVDHVAPAVFDHRQQQAEAFVDRGQVGLALIVQDVRRRNFDLAAFDVVTFRLQFGLECVNARLQFLGAADQFGEEVLDRSDGFHHGVLDGLPDLLDGFLDAFHRNGGGSSLAACAAEGFQRRSDGADVQTQATGVAVHGVVHEQSGLRVQATVFHAGFHGSADAFQAFGDFAQLDNVVGTLFGFGEGFGSFSDFLFNGVVRANNQLGVKQGVVFH